MVDEQLCPLCRKPDMVSSISSIVMMCGRCEVEFSRGWKPKPEIERPTSSRISSGKSFESEITASLRALSKTVAVAYQNSNAPIAVCDHIIWIGGTSILLEEKELRADRFPFSRISDAERKHMDGVTRAGCQAVILIKHITSSSVRVFACEWSDWLKMESGWGYVHGAEKQTRGSASFHVVRDRPEFMIELHRVTRRDSDGNSLGKHWDLSRVLFPNSLNKSEYDEGQKQWAKFAHKDAL